MPLACIEIIESVSCTEGFAFLNAHSVSLWWSEEEVIDLELDLSGYVDIKQMDLAMNSDELPCTVRIKIDCISK